MTEPDPAEIRRRLDSIARSCGWASAAEMRTTVTTWRVMVDPAEHCSCGRYRLAEIPERRPGDDVHGALLCGRFISTGPSLE